MGKYKRLKTRERVSDLDLYSFTGPYPEILDGIKENVESCIERYEELNPDVQNCVYSINGDYYGYDGGFEYWVECERDETDAEYDKRVEETKKYKNQEKERKAKKNAEELALYEKLKKKFG